MNDVLYDTSLTAYALPEPSPPLSSLLTTSPARLNDHAQSLCEHLYTGRAAWEREEEGAKIGGLRDCTFTLLHGAQEEQGGPHGVTASLLYDRVTYRFIFYGDNTPTTKSISKEKQRTPDNPLPLLLIKASSSLTTRFLSFLDSHFRTPTVIPIRLPATYLPSTLNTYIASLVTAHTAIATDHALLSFLQDTIGILKMSISITHAEAAKSLRTIDIDVPPETLYQLVTEASSDHNSGSGFLASLHKHLHARTGLLLPLAPSPANDTTADADDAEPPLKLSRISCAAFALSSEGRVKLSAKAVQAVDTIPGLGSGEENVVRLANGAMLRGLITVALTMGD